MTNIAYERLITNKLLLDHLDMWDEFDIKSVDDTKTVRYYNRIMNHIDDEIDAGVKWLDSEEAEKYFKEESQYHHKVFQSLEDEWDSILESKYDSIEALLSEVYRRGKAKGYTDMQEHVRYTEADKQALRIATEYNYHLINKIDNDVRNEIKNKIISGFLAGDNPNLIAPKIQAIAGEQLEGSTFTPRQRATMIAKTEISRVQNTGMLQSYINEGYTEVKILTAEDNNVCATCLEYAYEFNKNDEITYENAGKERTHNIIELIKGEKFPPFHPLCRCTYLSVWESKGKPPEKPYIIDLRPYGFTQSNIRSLFPSDNTYIEELDKHLIHEQLDGFKYFTENKEIEYCEIYDKDGVSMVDIIVGDDEGVKISWEELRDYVLRGAFIVVHNHPLNFDSLHSPDDLITQLKSGIKYSIVESYTKRFIVVNTNNMMDDNDQLVKNITRFGNDFYGKIGDLTQQIINQKTEEHMKNTGKPYDYYELEKIKNEVYINLIKKHINEYEEGIQKFFKPGTGLKLFVHDKDYGEL